MNYRTHRHPSLRNVTPLRKPRRSRYWAFAAIFVYGVAVGALLPSQTVVYALGLATVLACYALGGER